MRIDKDCPYCEAKQLLTFKDGQFYWCTKCMNEVEFRPNGRIYVYDQHGHCIWES